MVNGWIQVSITRCNPVRTFTTSIHESTQLQAQASWPINVFFTGELEGLLVDITMHQFDLQIETKMSAARITIRSTIHQHVPHVSFKRKGIKFKTFRTIKIFFIFAYFY